MEDPSLKVQVPDTLLSYTLSALHHAYSSSQQNHKIIEDSANH